MPGGNNKEVGKRAGDRVSERLKTNMSEDANIRNETEQLEDLRLVHYDMLISFV